MVNRIYQLQYDDEIDKDVHDFIEKYPRNRKAEMVRLAIRFYLNHHGKKLVPTITPLYQNNVIEEVEKPKRPRPQLPLSGIKLAEGD